MQNTKSMKKHATHGISGFELLKIALHNLKHFDLKPNTKTVLMLLVDCYNPENGSVVFPSMEYIATEGAMSLTSAKEGIKELINKGLIIKSKRGKIRGNYNKYLLTPKVQNPTSEWTENELLKQSENDCFMIGTNKREKIKEQTKENVVAFKTFSSHKTVTLDDVPEIIKNNTKIDNPCAYWASLSEEVKTEKIKDDKKEKEKQRQKAVIVQKRKERNRIKKQEEQRLKNECHKPLKEQFTYESAYKFIKNIANMDKKLVYKGISKELATLYSIDVKQFI